MQSIAAHDDPVGRCIGKGLFDQVIDLREGLPEETHIADPVIAKKMAEIPRFQREASIARCGKIGMNI